MVAQHKAFVNIGLCLNRAMCGCRREKSGLRLYMFIMRKLWFLNSREKG